MKAVIVLVYMVSYMKKTNIKKFLILIFVCLLSTTMISQDKPKNQKTACFAVKTLSEKEKAFFQLLALKLSSLGYKTISAERCLNSDITLTNYHSNFHQQIHPIYFFDFKSSQIFSRPPIQNNYTEIYTDKQTDKNEPYIDLNNLHTSVVKIAKDIQLKKFQNKYFKITLMSSKSNWTLNIKQKFISSQSLQFCLFLPPKLLEHSRCNSRITTKITI